MRIEDLNERVQHLKKSALRARGIDDEIAASIVLAEPPNPDMGDIGFPCFVLARHLRMAPPKIAAELAEEIRQRLEDEDVVATVDGVGPYVNFRWNRRRFAGVVLGQARAEASAYGQISRSDGPHWMIEFSAPNTNKPQHLGHVRNNLLGASVASIAGFAGHRVTRVNLINDRGIHICKSMLAYQEFAVEEGRDGVAETPESSGTKGDHFVGKYYVRFESWFMEEYRNWQGAADAQERLNAWRKKLSEKRASEPEDLLRNEFFSGFKDTYFNELSTIGRRTKEMLVAWEANDPDVVELWNTMNAWVFSGFDETYGRMGVEFEKVYRESETYLLGKDIVLTALEAGQLKRLEDGAVVCDLEEVGLQGQKALLRRDGTSVYMTQDLGTASARFDAFGMDRMIYVVADEQDYHFDVLFRVLSRVRPDLEGRCQHLSYGMVMLPEGKMKSREGTVVDADDLMDEMTSLADQSIAERYPDLDPAARAARAPVIGMAALKYYILDFNPKTSVHFDPKKSIEFEGRTGPYCQYSYARIQSIRRKMGGWPQLTDDAARAAMVSLLSDLEQQVIKELQEWPRIVALAARLLDPSKITEHLFKICKAFSTLYNDSDHRIVDLTGHRRDGLLLLSQIVGTTLETGLGLLGIDVLDEM
jgi:arginyl-tRNA synthetase